MANIKQETVKLVATGCYSGFLKPYAGTWGTIPAWLIGYFLIANNQILLITIAILSIFISVWSAGEAEKVYGHDARKIVIDEWAGMFITFLFLPYSWQVYVIAFFAFRFWDVVKLPPAKQFERLPGGWGITFDDVIAGIYANLTVLFIIYILNKYFEIQLV